MNDRKALLSFYDFPAAHWKHQPNRKLDHMNSTSSGQIIALTLKQDDIRHDIQISRAAGKASDVV
jgi:hypothetical protein